ncbi:MAG TPA: twin-arginine translocase TatA/TatE family subunit [Terracidiphilus sp.]|nr:twin-arginine translocase TatA/TatE family subunit [Terracidiphilus sp.]
MVAPPPIQVASIGMADSIILMILALVVFGPRRLPQIGRQIGKLMYEFRKASNDFKFQMEEELRIAEDADRRKKEEEERQRNLALTASTQPPSQTIEAAAAVGADDQASVSAPPPAAPESGYPETAPSGAAPAAEQHAPYPRINPPSTGEQVAATKPGTASQPETAPAASGSSEPNVGAGQSPNGTGSQPSQASPASADSPTETVTHHG